MGGKFGVKSTEAVLDLVQVVAVAIVEEAQKSGWKWSDVPAFLKSPELEAKVAPVLASGAQVPAELGELDIMDDIELGKHVYGIVQTIVAELKKVPKATA